MPRRRVHSLGITLIGAALCFFLPRALPVQAEEHRPPTVAIAPTTAATRSAAIPLQRPEASETAAAAPAGSWWFGTVGTTLALIAAGGLSWLAKGRNTASGLEASGLRVIARTALSSKHTLHTVRAGERILIIGTGVGGPPALLADWPASEREPNAVRSIPRPGGGS